MDKNEIIEMLTAQKSATELAMWLRQSYFPEIIRRFNSENSRKRFGLYQNEKIPTNERNLTDVRTRMGGLIEFELARISNELLQEYQINDIFWSYVVANRFPDLEVRNNAGERQLRLEIKCLQYIAEEKSANFDTLKKDIDPKTDYVVVCVWDWSSNPSATCNWDAVPLIDKAYVFHAYSLTALRDCYWLNNPPKDIGNGYQGFDVRYAVTYSKGKYWKEYGNYGKITRLWKQNFPYRPIETEELLDTENEYLPFQKEIIFEGFRIITNKQLRELCTSEDQIDDLCIEGRKVGFRVGEYIYILYPLIGLNPNSNAYKATLKRMATDYHAKIIVSMKENYQSTIYLFTQDGLTKLETDLKPKKVVEFIRHL